MKKFISLIVAALALVNFANAQNFYLNFEGTPQFIPVDSLIVTNLNTQENANLTGSDELHLVAPQLARTLNNNRNNKLFIYPNPAPGYCSFDIPVDRDALVTIEIFDLTGKKLLSDTRFLDKAAYNIMLKGLSSGVYTVVAKSDNFLFTGKVIGSENNNYHLAIEYTGKSELSPEYLQLRELQNITDMVYSFGDILLFKAFSGQEYITVKTLIINQDDAIAQQENITISFAFFACTGLDNYTYPIVTIGDQVWMAENLKTASYRNQNEIPEVTDSLQWLSLLTGAYCSYSNNPENDSLYGKLYNWYAVGDTAGICPQGWHVPSDSEWMELETYLGMDANFITTLGWRGQNEGCYLKDSHSNMWFSLIGDNLNSSGFSAVPAGMRNFVSSFYYRGEYATWWTASESNGQDAWSRAVSYDKCSIYREDGRKTLGLSVRCIKDDEVEPQPVVPTVVTAEVTAINKTSAVSGGEVISDGGDPVTARGIVWSTATNPTVDVHMGITADGTGTGIFSGNMSGLEPATTYYVKAYATNTIGTAYGDELSFTTLEFAIPEVVTAEAAQISYTSAVSGGEVTGQGDGSVSMKGVVWSTTNTPSLASNEGITYDGEGPGVFISSIEGLLPGTVYYVKAYATNEYGTAYGEEIAFSTLAYSLPVITTEPVTEITTTAAISGGNITDNGGDIITARGVVWNTLGEPDIDNNEGITYDGDGMGVFISNIEDLSPGQTYYVRAYATNSAGTAYGEELSFTTLPLLYTTGDGVYDIDGNFYPTVILDGREWMSQNLRVSRYNEASQGSSIAKVTDNIEWQMAVGQYGAYCWYNNDSTTNEVTYGKLYNFPAVEMGTLCPLGWHVPTDIEWKDLEIFLGLTPTQADETSWRGTVEGGMMKLTGTGHWASPNTAATDQSGLSSFPGGQRYSDGSFSQQGIYNFFWSQTRIDTNNAWMRELGYDTGATNRHDMSILGGLSVRCIKTIIAQAQVITTEPSNITSNSALSGGYIQDFGGSTSITCGVVWSTIPSPTLEMNEGFTNDMYGGNTYESELYGLSPATPYYVRAYVTNEAGTSYGNEYMFTTTPLFVCGDPVTFTYNGTEVTYGTVLFAGRCWFDRNLGATQVATSEADANAYGDLFQWGREDDGHQIRTSSTIDVLAIAQTQPGHNMFIYNYMDYYDWNEDENWILRWTDPTGAALPADPCPDGWHVPVLMEWQDAITNGGLTNSTDAFNSSLKMTLGGDRSGFKDVFNEGYSGSYWTSTGSSGGLGNGITMTTSNINSFSIEMVNGFSVRCIKDEGAASK